ncbi:acetoin dehydrogenase dihydrolipoyllysine-residue acetyltransferase subunit [Novosphingobium sp.]|uniref:acetoin dehydrogenase dihydrolipoyllysine-residue acetyltransferase subunit n=1 Tax=Novosphingobium sp. TaxID=1874826 RepID=UPI00286E648A|nr:acetoin dehydrogenase dihydrolipoyllysine-residue acetyltransferase subunit [Novosphingobium sp.]
MTLYPVAVPKWGLAMEEGTLSTWLVKEGAIVAQGDEIAEIESSKIANVFEAPAAGVLRRIVAQEGDLNPVGALLAVIADGDEDDAVIDAFVAEYQDRFATEAVDQVSGPVPEVAAVPGGNIRYLKVAGGDATPVVLLHGFGGDYLNWMMNQAALAEGRDVYAVDLPGHGESYKQLGDASLDELAQSIAAWMGLQGLEKAHVVGHSMGAGVALALAAVEPERVHSITGICGVGFGGTLNSAYVEGFTDAEKRKELKGVVELLFTNAELVSREMLDDLLAYKRIDGVDAALRGLLVNALSAASVAEAEARRQAAAVPVLAIYGDSDQVVATPDEAARPSGAVLITGAGHMPQLEAADAVNAAISAFVRAHD